MSPTVENCRYAVLPLSDQGYVVYDRLNGRIVDGVYLESTGLAMALGVAQAYNKGFDPGENMTPTGEALALIYPGRHSGK